MTREELAMNRPKLRMLVEVEYEPYKYNEAGAKVRLQKAIMHLVDRGMLTGDTDMETVNVNTSFLDEDSFGDSNES